MPVRPTPPTFPRGGGIDFEWFREMLRRGWLSPYGISRFLRPLEDPFPGPGDPFPDPGRQFPPAKQTEKIELLTSALDRPIVLAYGRHIVGGNVIYQNENADGTVTLFIALGEGEWDSIERVWVNGLEINLADTTLVHFHPGLEGELGIENSPVTRNQKVCSFFPSDFAPPLTFSRTAYLALKLKREPTQPGPDFHVLGIYRTLRVRDFDHTGFAGYTFSANPARLAMDILLRRFLLPHGTVNQVVPSAALARLDLPAWNDWKNFCDTEGFQAHLAFVDSTDLLRALEWVLLQGRGYLLERNGKLAPFADQARSSRLTVGIDNLAANSLQLLRRNLRDSPNRFLFRFRHLDSGTGPGTLTSLGVTLTGLNTQFTKFFKPGQSIVLLDGPQAGQGRVVDEVTSDTALKLKTAFSVDQSAGRHYANPSLDFMPQVKEAADEERQDEVGRVLKVEVDLGNSTPERAERLAEHLKRRTLDLERQLRCRLLPDLAGGVDLVPGDLITAPDALDYSSSRIWEIMELSDEPDGSREIFALEYDQAVFVDEAGPQQVLVHIPNPGGGLAFNAPQQRSVLQNGSFFRVGVVSQEGTDRPKFFNGYSNSGGSPAWTTDLEHDLANDKVKVKTKTSSVNNIGLRSLWKNLGRLFKPGQVVTLAVSLRHNGAAGVLYDKDVKLKLDSNAEDYVQADSSKFVGTIAAGVIPFKHIVRFVTFTLRADIAVPDTLNAFIWSEATGAAKANEDLEIDWIALGSGRFPPSYEPVDEVRDADITWDAGTSRYSLPTYLAKDTAASSDVGGAGGTSGGSAGSSGDDPASGAFNPI